MKNFLFSLLSLFVLNSFVVAQSPSAFKYQAVARTAAGGIVANKKISLRISILASSANGATIYSEKQVAITNAFGLINLEIGNGTLLSGNFNAMNLSGTSHFVKIEMDLSGGDAFVFMGTSQLLSVPYALYAKTSGSSLPGPKGDKGDVGPKGDQGLQGVDVPQTLSFVKDSIVLSNGGGIIDNVVTLTGAKKNGNLISYDGTNWVCKSLLTNVSGDGQPFSIVQPYLGLNYQIALQGVFPSRNMAADPYLGSIGISGFDFAARGWALCQGQLLPISQNTALFSLLGTNYGGNGQTTFALPDLRGRVVIGAGNGPGLSSYLIGQTGGKESVTLLLNQMPAHNHKVVTY